MAQTDAPTEPKQPKAPKAPKEPKEKAPKEAKAKHRYMLHSPDGLHPLGKYVSTDYRYAALKAVSRWHKKGVRRFLLRRTNSKEVLEYEGFLVPLKEPKEIKRAGAEAPILYHFKPDVKYVDAWVMDGTKLLPIKAAAE